jgi:transposase-like protein
MTARLLTNSISRRVQLVIADAHLGLRQAVSAVMAGAAVQRCRVH